MVGIQVLFIIAPQNFRDEEYFKPKKIIEDAGFDVITASKGVKIATGSMGGKAKIDIDVTDVEVEDYDAVIMAGGNGVMVFNGDSDINRIFQEADENRLLIGAICLAPIVLATAGVLDDRECTCWNGDSMQKSKLELAGAVYISDENVVIHHNLITANGPEASVEFGEAIINNL